MSVKTVAILSPGDMGHAVGRVLGEHGLDVITCLDGRSARTRNLANKSNFRIAANLEEMVAMADLVLSILVPTQAEAVAKKVAAASSAAGVDLVFAECNAISPQRTKALCKMISDIGGTYIDGSIIGPPPGSGGYSPRFYVSGPRTDAIEELDCKGITVKVLGNAVGEASGIKMCYAAMTKGTSTLQVALLVAAERMGLSEALRSELEFSQSDVLGKMEAGIPRLPANAHRWIGEMEEIEFTFKHLGITGGFHEAAAEIYRLLDSTPFARETPETLNKGRTLQETIQVAAQHLNKKIPGTE